MRRSRKRVILKSLNRIGLGLLADLRLQGEMHLLAAVPPLTPSIRINLVRPGDSVLESLIHQLGQHSLLRHGGHGGLIMPQSLLTLSLDWYGTWTWRFSIRNRQAGHACYLSHK